MSSTYEYKPITIKYSEGAKRGTMYLWFSLRHFIRHTHTLVPELWPFGLVYIAYITLLFRYVGGKADPQVKWRYYKPTYNWLQ